MANKLFMLSFITLFISLNCLPSDDIWNKVKKIIGSKTDYNKINNVNYFLFQEKDYCQRNIDSEDMTKLFDKQKKFFINRKTSNYIFVVDKFDENLESLKDGAFHLSQYLYNELKVKMENSVLAIFSIQTRRIIIRTGEITKNNITDSRASSIISSLGDLLRQNNYYEAFLKYYDELDFYIEFYISPYYIILIPLFFFMGLIIISLIIGLLEMIVKKYQKWEEERKYSPKDPKLKNIVSFMKSQKKNKKIFEENCVICLNALEINIKKEFKDKKETEIAMELEEINNKPLLEKMDDSNSLSIKKEEANTNIIEKNEKGISTLNCGHQFHTKCIIKWLKIKSNCPICRKKVLKENDNNKIIWDTQSELYQEYNNISYQYIYRNYLNPPSIQTSSSNDSFNYSSNYSSNYDYHRGVNLGGGAIGGW